MEILGGNAMAVHCALDEPQLGGLWVVISRVTVLITYNPYWGPYNPTYNYPNPYKLERLPGNAGFVLAK